MPTNLRGRAGNCQPIFSGPHFTDLFAAQRHADYAAAYPEVDRAAWEAIQHLQTAPSAAELVAQAYGEEAPVYRPEPTGNIELVVRRYLTDDPSPGMPKVLDIVTDCIHPNTELVLTAPTGTGKTTFWKKFAGRAILVVPFRAIARQLHEEGFGAWYGGNAHGNIHADKIVCTIDKLPDLVLALGERAKEYVLFLDEPQEIPNASNYRGGVIMQAYPLRRRFRSVVYMSATTEKLRRFLDDFRVGYTHIRVRATHGPKRRASIVETPTKELPGLIAATLKRTGKAVAVLHDDRAALDRTARKLIRMKAVKADEVAIIMADTQPTEAERHILTHGTMPPGIRVLLTTKKISAGPNIAGDVVPIVVDNVNRKADDVVQFAGRFRGADTHTIIVRPTTYNVSCEPLAYYLKMHEAFEKLDRFAWTKDERKMLEALHNEARIVYRGGAVAAWELAQRERDRLDMQEGLIGYLQRHDIDVVPLADMQVDAIEEADEQAVKADIAHDREAAIRTLDEAPAEAIGQTRAMQLGPELDLSDNERAAEVLDEAFRATGQPLAGQYDKLCADYLKALQFTDHAGAIKVVQTFQRAGKAIQAMSARTKAKEQLAGPPTDRAAKVVHELREAFTVGNTFTRDEAAKIVADIMAGHKLTPEQYYGQVGPDRYWWMANLYATFERRRGAVRPDGSRPWEYVVVAFADPLTISTNAGIVQINPSMSKKETVNVDSLQAQTAA